MEKPRISKEIAEAIKEQMWIAFHGSDLHFDNASCVKEMCIVVDRFVEDREEKMSPQEFKE